MDTVEMILAAAGLIYKLYEKIQTTKANKERCHRVAERVRTLEELVWTVKQRGPDHISDIVGKALNELWFTLLSAKELMMRFTKSKAVKNFTQSKSNEERFCKINQRLTENFQVLSAALQIEQGNVLQRVYESVSCMNQNDKQPLGTAALTPSPMSTPPTPPPMSTPMMPPPMSTPMMPPPMSTPMMPPPMSTPLMPPPPPPNGFHMPAYHQATPTPAHCFMPPQMSVPIMSPVQVVRPMNSMTFTQNIGPAVVPHYGPAMAPMPLVNPVLIMSAPPQNTSFVSSVVNSFFH